MIVRPYLLTKSVLLGALVLLCAGCDKYPSTDRLTSGELLLNLGRRALIPPGVILRPVYPPGIRLVQESEGWLPKCYNDAAKYCTIGYGHLIKRAPCDGTEPVEFRHTLTSDEGTALLLKDLATAQYAVMTAVAAPLTDGQFASLTDFVFNVGSANFRSSTLLMVVNAKQLDRVPGQFKRWVMAGGKPWPGLIERRDREVDVFFDGLNRSRALPEGELPPIDIRLGESK
jgi:lysozyme